MSKTPRRYQLEAIDAVAAQWAKPSVRATLIVLATGLGKTFTAVRICAERAKHGRILWLAHRGELLEQAGETFEDVGLRWELEKAESRASRSAGLYGAAPVVVGSVQSLRGRRLWDWPKDSFDTIIVDEAHHATAKTYRDILEHFEKANVLGLTATPDRADTVGLHNVFDSCAYEYNIRNGIEDRYLVPITQKQVFVDDIDISCVRSVGGDLAQGELEEAMLDGGALHKIAKPLTELAGDRGTLIFTVGVAHARALAEVLGNYVDPAKVRSVSGETEKMLRRQYVADFRSGAVQYMVNCEVFTEGFDAPETACIACCRPTKSRALYTQMVGRGTRLYAGNGVFAEKLEPHHPKQDCLVLDFVGNSGEHRLITAMDVLAGEILEPDILQDALDMSDMPSHEALRRAEERKAARELAELERRKRARKIRADVNYKTLNRDPFSVVGVKRDPYGPEASDKQRAFLKNLGVQKLPEEMSKREASKLISQLLRRRQNDMASYKMARMLAKAGLNPDLPFKEAKQVIKQLAALGWPPRQRVPNTLKEKYGLQTE